MTRAEFFKTLSRMGYTPEQIRAAEKEAYQSAREAHEGTETEIEAITGKPADEYLKSIGRYFYIENISR